MCVEEFFFLRLLSTTTRAVYAFTSITSTRYFIKTCGGSSLLKVKTNLTTAVGPRD